MQGSMENDKYGNNWQVLVGHTCINIVPMRILRILKEDTSTVGVHMTDLHDIVIIPTTVEL